jgi:hypothetical protein
MASTTNLRGNKRKSITAIASQRSSDDSDDDFHPSDDQLTVKATKRSRTSPIKSSNNKDNKMADDPEASGGDDDNGGEDDTIEINATNMASPIASFVHPLNQSSYQPVYCVTIIQSMHVSFMELIFSPLLLHEGALRMNKQKPV